MNNFIRLTWGTLVGAWVFGCAWGKPPDWVTPYLTADIAALSRGQSAVKLADLDEVHFVSSDRVLRRYRTILRVITNQGRSHALCQITYNADTERVRSAQAWVIQADGKECTTYRIGDFADSIAQYSRYFWNQQRTLTFNAARWLGVGGTLAWEVEIELQTGIANLSWTMASDLAVNHCVFEVTPATGGRLEWHTSGAQPGSPQPGATPGALRWEQHRTTAPSGDEPDDFLPDPLLVSVRHIAAQPTPDAVTTWNDMARLAAAIIEPRILATPEVQAKASALVAGKTGRWARVRALAEFVQKEIAYLSVTLDKDYLAGYRPHPSGEVLQNRYGDCKDKAGLLCALLRSIGEEGAPILVSADNPRAIDPAWPTAAFDHVIVGILSRDPAPAGWPTVGQGDSGSIVLFDPTDSETPLGLLPENEQGGRGLLVSQKTTGLVQLPTAGPEQNRTECRVRAELDATGELTAHVEETLRGTSSASAYAIREQLRTDGFTKLMEARLHESTPFVQNVQWTDTWDPVTPTWQLNYDFKAERYGRQIGADRLLVSPPVTVTQVRLSPWQTNQAGVSLQSASSLHAQVTITLPENCQIEEVPDDWQQELPTATYRIGYRKAGRDVVYESAVIQRAAFLEKTDYEALRNLVLKFLQAERRPIIVRRTATPKTP